MKKLIIILIIILISCEKEDLNNGKFKDRRDKKVYEVIELNKLYWMTENLGYNADGSVVYDNNPSNEKIYGRLYEWETAQDVCPDGWRLPTIEEWYKVADNEEELKIVYGGWGLLNASSTEIIFMGMNLHGNYWSSTYEFFNDKYYCTYNSIALFNIVYIIISWCYILI